MPAIERLTLRLDARRLRDEALSPAAAVERFKGLLGHPIFMLSPA